MSSAVFLERASLDAGDIDIKKLHEALPGLTVYEKTNQAQLLQRIRNAECILVNKLVIDANVIAKCPDLKLICTIATGTNNIDLDAAEKHGVTVVNCRDYGTASLTQHVLMLILALTRSLLPYSSSVHNGRWSEAKQFCLLDHPIVELNGRVLGVLGYGKLGRSVAQLAKCLGMTVLIGERPGATEVRSGRVPLEKLLSQIDVLSIHCPLTSATQGLISKAELSLMKRSAILINTARGGIVDETELVTALREGIIAGAGVDVLIQEPPSASNPLLATDIPNLLVTPHCAWASREARQRVVNQTVENILAWKRNQPIRVVST